MDLEEKCKDKLAYLRVKELKDVLTQVGLSKQGKKQDLVDRILAVFAGEHVSKSHGWGKRSSIGKEGVAKIIDDTFRKMQGPGATDLASKSNSGSNLSVLRCKEEVVDSKDLHPKVRCPCASSLVTDSMIQCEDVACQVWQHIGCVIIPEKFMEGVTPEIPSCFYCELCRLKRADPFFIPIHHTLIPIKLTSSGTTADGTPTVQNMDRTFSLSRTDRELLQKKDYDLQVWCLLLNDKVPFRMQWPQYAELQVNGISSRTSNRPGSQMLGINGRDDASVITTCSREGINKICLSRCDARVFCFGIRLVRKRTFQQVFSVIPKEADGECFDNALTRVLRCVGGGTTKENADDDSDLEVVADTYTMNLRCPMTGSRMRIAGRFRPCIHMGCFDLEAFVELNQRSRKWQCPICLKNYSLENVIIDSYFNRITSMMRNCTDDIDEIEIKPDGSWRAKCGAEFRELAQWHLPNGSIFPTLDVDTKPDLAVLRQFKQDASSSEGGTGLKIGIKKDRNGMWQVSKSGALQPPSSLNHGHERYDSRPNVMPPSSSATGSYRDGDDASVNQDGGHFDFSVSNGHEHNSFYPTGVPACYPGDRMPLAPLEDAGVIVLSDSEEDTEAMSFETGYDTGPAAHTGIPYSDDVHGLSESLLDDPLHVSTGPSCVDLFNHNGVDLGPIWPMRADPAFQLFTTDFQPDGVLDAPIGGYEFTSDGALGNGSEVRNTETNEVLVDNPLAYGSDDPSLQFFPTQSSTDPLQSDLGDHADLPHGDHPDSWISLNLLDRQNPGDGLKSSKQLTSKVNKMESAPDATLLPYVSGDRSKKAEKGKRGSITSSHPRQPRSVRPRPIPPVDSDSG